MSLLAVVCAAALLEAQGPLRQASGREAVRRAFDTPPDDARVMMRWWWFGPAVSDASLDRDLRAMKDAGLGGVEVQPVYPLALDDDSTGHRTAPYLSREFLAALAHARATAARLDLRFDLTLGSGWPFGGPSVAAADAAGALRIVRLPQPAGTRHVGLPVLDGGERIIAAYLTAGADIPVDPEAFTRLDHAEAVAGRIALPAPLVAEHLAWVFIASRSGMMVKRPAIGGEGFVLNHYDRAATSRYLEAVGGPMLSALASLRPFAVFCDSLEVFGSDWTPDLLDVFESRYGYDLREHLPALATGDAVSADAGQRIRAIRHDWAQLLTERLESEFLSPMRAWARGRGAQLRVQTYGMPPARPSSARLVDLPEGEGAQWRTVSSTRWASSAAHVFGRPVASSETWTWLHSPSFAATPLDIKAEADRHFLQGITQLIGHGWPNTPAGVEWPGARFYAAAVLSDANPWWLVMPEVARYLQRTSGLLRLGTARNDVALYLPVHDLWSRMRPGEVHLFDMARRHVGERLVGSLLDAGFGFDVVDDESLRTGRVEGRTLVVGTARFRAVVLPRVRTVSPEVMRVLADFAAAGGVVVPVGEVPSLAPGRMASDAQHAAVRAAADTVLATGAMVADDAAVGAQLASRVRPAVVWGDAASSLGFVHRQIDDADLYFVANTGNRPIATTVAFSAGAGRRAHVERWDPVTGERHAVTAERGAEGVRVALALSPYASTFFLVAPSPPTAVWAEVPSLGCGTPQRVVDLSSSWTMEIAGQPPRRLEALASWHECSTTRFFSGVATYRRDVDVSASAVAGGCPVWLDFGEGAPRAEEPLTNGMRTWLDAPIREGARVIVNGRDVGAVWTPPYRLDLRPALRAGSNTIEVRVGNTALNGWSARPQPDYTLLHLRYGKRFEPQDLAGIVPQPSGIIGRPRLVW